MIKPKLLELISNYEELIGAMGELLSLKNSKNNNLKQKRIYLTELKDNLLDEIDSLRTELRFTEID